MVNKKNIKLQRVYSLPIELKCSYFFYDSQFCMGRDFGVFMSFQQKIKNKNSFHFIFCLYVWELCFAFLVSISMNPWPLSISKISLPEWKCTKDIFITFLNLLFVPFNKKKTEKMFNMLVGSQICYIFFFTLRLLCIRSFEDWIINVSHTKFDAQRWSSKSIYLVACFILFLLFFFFFFFFIRIWYTEM